MWELVGERPLAGPLSKGRLVKPEPHHARPLICIHRSNIRDLRREPDGQRTNKRPDEKPEHYPAHLTDPLETPSPAPPSEASTAKLGQVPFHRRLPHVRVHGECSRVQ